MRRTQNTRNSCRGNSPSHKGLQLLLCQVPLATAVEQVKGGPKGLPTQECDLVLWTCTGASNTGRVQVQCTPQALSTVCYNFLNQPKQKHSQYTESAGSVLRTHMPGTYSERRGVD